MKLTLCALSIFALSIVANADTLTLTNNSSLNGSVRYEEGVFYIQADYADATLHYAIPRAQVTSDEINNETFNQGSPLPDIRAHRVGHEMWATVNIPGEPSKDATTTAQRIAAPEETAQRAGSARTKARVGALIDPALASSSSPGEDTLAFINKTSQTGTLTRMTSNTIVFRANGARTDTEYARDRVKIVKVKKSG